MEHVELNTGPGIARQLARSLRKRGTTFGKICKVSTIGRSHGSQVINGKRACTKTTWARLEPYLTHEERMILREVPRRANVSDGTIHKEVEHVGAC